jgi:hypothetical protein
MLLVNDKAIIVCMPAIIVGVMLEHSLHASDVVANCAAGLFATMLDMLFRRKAGDKRLLDPRAGGHIVLVPVWIWGLVLHLRGGFRSLVKFSRVLTHRNPAARFIRVAYHMRRIE